MKKKLAFLALVFAALVPMAESAPPACVTTCCPTGECYTCCAKVCPQIMCPANPNT
jgi:hypothetical protein